MPLPLIAIFEPAGTAVSVTPLTRFHGALAPVPVPVTVHVPVPIVSVVPVAAVSFEVVTLALLDASAPAVRVIAFVELLKASASVTVPPLASIIIGIVRVLPALVTVALPPVFPNVSVPAPETPTPLERVSPPYMVLAVEPNASVALFVTPEAFMPASLIRSTVTVVPAAKASNLAVSWGKGTQVQVDPPLETDHFEESDQLPVPAIQ